MHGSLKVGTQVMTEELLTRLGLIAGKWRYFKPVRFPDGTHDLVEVDENDKIEGPRYYCTVTAVTKNSTTLE